MSVLQLLEQKFSQPSFPPAVALGGNERALLDEGLQFLRTKFLSSENASYNYSQLIAGESDLSNLFVDLNTLPFLATMRFVEVHAAEKTDEKITDAIFEYLQNPSATSFLLLIFNRTDKRNKLINNLIKRELFYCFDAANQSDRLKYIINEAKNSRVQLGDEVAQFLSLIFDNDLIAIKSALNRLALLFENRVVLIEDIQKNLSLHGEQDVFLLARSISEGKLAESLGGLERLRNSQEHVLKFLGVLAWQFRVLLKIRYGIDQGMPEQEISKQVLVYGERFRWMASISRKKNLDFHKTRLLRLLECDKALKSINSKNPFNFIEKLVYQSAAGL